MAKPFLSLNGVKTGKSFTKWVRVGNGFAKWGKPEEFLLNKVITVINDKLWCKK
jgi:hypothetical protein